ncbi:glutamate 5-kinase [Solemya pervernicosa gill symbiont]|uniref:Glutamate 5-kinase n=2 Tax=Gammaproteobacteria incertae sedis TaxID=118884 RepID=A0A1T2L8E1_9GAMM|nr:glutamate 5-kinase [Candidatus Reidiella endopervernicosa]OOZ41351.1 glutamate 5-kinase [Solemya pervernicosa gill symbiont]QKQ27729.1 glutamate 5-kinase [Candidatus Reidiella endopervernicosa]
MKGRVELGASKRWVVKIGSALLTDEGRGLDRAAIAGWVEQIARLRQAEREVVLVSSGSVAEGMSRLGLSERPRAVHELQAAAAVGQMGLVQTYESEFQRHGLHTAQVLLTHDDLSDRNRYLNARSTIRTLLGLGVIPVVNENDTVAVEEIRLGDNDTLGALVANLVEADLLVILTDQQGLFDSDPRRNPDAALIEEGAAGDAALEAMAGDSGGSLGRGGMQTKVLAAARAARSGAATVIVSGREERVLLRVAAGESVGTLLHPAQELMAARKQWLAGQLQVRGRVVLDTGAVRVLREQGRSLLPVGITAVEGRFMRGELVECVDNEGVGVARGLANYSAEEVNRIKREPSDRIEQILGYVDEPEFIHRDNLVLS